jgi:hypothetical protein
MLFYFNSFSFILSLYRSEFLTYSFPSLWKSYFNTSFKEALLVMNYLRFLFIWKSFYPFLVIINFVGYRILGWWILIFFFFLVIEFWTQSLTLAWQVLYHLSHASSLFALVIFQIESPIFARPASDSYLTIKSPV